MRDITLEETVYFNFTTRSFSTGVPTVLGGAPVLSVLESNNATPITSGVSVSVDRASVVGLNQATVVATAANGYEAGKSYSVYISTGTVGGVSVVGEVVAQFTVQSAASFTRLGAPAGASVSADVAAVKVDTAAILVDTGTTLDARIPAALVGGRMDCSVGAMAANTLTASALATDAVTEIQAGLATPTNITAGTITTVTNLTNAATNGDLTATMKTSVTTAATAATPTAAAVTGAVGSVTAGVTVTTNNDKTGYRLSSTGVGDILTTALTESYATDGSAMTLSQALYQLWSLAAEKSIATTTLTAKKLDGTTTSMTFTLNDATSPTSITRAT